MSSDPRALSPGEMVDHFRVMRTIGRGGQGSVYAARDTKLGRKVALKLISPRKMISQKRIDRFLFEARATARFSHPNIVTIYSVGEHLGLPYVALEYVDGETLRERIRAGLGPKEALRIALQIAIAVAEAHRNGVLHRDLKPENVVISTDGRIRVLDFGLAALIDRSIDSEAPSTLDLVSTTTSGGTPSYMAPEQWLQRAPSEATDVWAIAVITYELLAGRRPFEADTLQALAEKVVGTDPPPALVTAELPAPIWDLIGRGLDRSPLLRPSARALAEAIEAALAGESALDAGDSPFPGLVPFGERQASLFFGRSREIVAFIERARTSPILPVIGPSGAGKSSFVQAGVIPMLRERSRWVVLRVRPGPRPFATLAQRLLRSTSASLESVAPIEEEIAEVVRRLENAPQALALELLALADREESNVLLFVDQLEEICTLVEDPRLRERFLLAVLSAADDPQDPVRVVFTLRDDFLGKLPGGALVEHVLGLGRSTVLRPPTDDQLIEVIQGPLRARGYQFDDPRLPAEMIAAVSGSSAALPLLQFTCRALWDRKRPGVRIIERSVHDAIGGVAGALAAHADGVLDGMSENQLQLSRALLLRLVTAEGTRRVLGEEATVDALGAGAEEVRERFVEARLLSVHRSSEGRRYELAHESLISTWKRFARWIDEEREDLAFLEEIERAAELWQKRGRRLDEAWRDRALAEAKLKLSRLRRPLTAIVREFVDAGEMLDRKRILQRRVLSAVAFSLLAALAGLFYLGKERAEVERARAEMQRARAEREASELAHARGDGWAARARLRSALEISDDVRARALWLRLEADPIRFSSKIEAMRVLAGDRFLLLRWGEPILMLDPIDFEARGTIEVPPESYIFAADGEGRIAAGTSDGTIAIVGGRSAKHHRGPVSALAFSPDGATLASGGWDGRVLLHRLPSLEPYQNIEGHTDRVYGIRFGKEIYTAGWDGTLRAWDPSSGAGREVWRSPSKIVDMELSKDMLAIGREDGAIELHRGDDHRIIRDHALSVTGVAFHPKQPWLASASWDGTVRLFDLASGRALGSPIRLGDKANDIAFRPHSSQAMVVLRGTGITALDLSRPHQADDPGPPPLADVVDVAGDGTIAATAPGHRIVLRDPATGRALRLLEGHSDVVRAVAFRPGHAELASGGFDETVRVFDTATGKMRHILTGHRGPISMVAYSPDGRLLASASFDQKLRLFDAETGALLATREAPARLITVRFSTDGRLATGTFAGHVEVYRTSDLQRVAAYRCANERIAHEVVFDGDAVLAICGPTLETFSSGGQSAIELGAEYACLALSQDRLLHSSGEKILLAMRDRSPIAEIPRPTHACAFSPDGSFFVTVEPDGAVRKYDREGKPAWQGASGSTELVFGELSAAGRSDGTAVIRDREGELLSVRLFGPISGIALTSSSTLSITSELGDRRDVDVAPLVMSYCDLMRSVWKSAPSIWRGTAVPASPPLDHRCR